MAGIFPSVFEDDLKARIADKVRAFPRVFAKEDEGLTKSLHMQIQWLALPPKECPSETLLTYLERNFSFDLQMHALDTVDDSAEFLALRAGAIFVKIS